jgi:hypothetical protein
MARKRHSAVDLPGRILRYDRGKVLLARFIRAARFD